MELERGGRGVVADSSIVDDGLEGKARREWMEPNPKVSDLAVETRKLYGGDKTKQKREGKKWTIFSNFQRRRSLFLSTKYTVA